jgi:hypothetical protein
MDTGEYLRDPISAAAVAAVVTAAYIHLKAKLNNEPVPQTSAYVKPAILNGIMVYFIVAGGMGQKEVISSEPF